MYHIVYHAFSASSAKLLKGMAGTTGLGASPPIECTQVIETTIRQISQNRPKRFSRYADGYTGDENGFVCLLASQKTRDSFISWNARDYALESEHSIFTFARHAFTL